MLSLFTKVKSAKPETTGKLFTFVTRGSEVPAPRTCPEADYLKKPVHGSQPQTGGEAASAAHSQPSANGTQPANL